MFGDFKAADTVLLKRGEGTDVNVLDSKELGETKH
jgi:hypothetical protein